MQDFLNQDSAHITPGESATDPLVSVIVPNYNYRRFLKERLDSILNQSFQDFELIILDDCSVDDSRSLIEKYRDHPKVSHIVFNEENTGRPFVQWERGLRLARGRYAWIAEADDSAEPSFLEKAVRAIKADPGVALVKTMSQHIDAAGMPSPRKYFEAYPPDGNTYIFDGNRFISELMLHRNSCYNASMILFSVEKWRNMPNRLYMNMRYAGDWLFWGLIMQDAKVAEVRQRLNKFRFHGRSVTDEGFHKLHARISPIVEAESTCVKVNLQKVADRSGTEPRKRRWIRQYYNHKFLHDSDTEDIRQALREIDEQSLRIMAGERVNYPWIWIYKHWFWNRSKNPVADPDISSGSLLPLAVFS